MSNFKIKLIAVFIISAAVVLSIASAWNDSIIVDEVPHIGAGYSYLTKQDMRLNPEHPPLAKDLAAVPLLFANLKQDVFNSEFWQTDLNGQWNFGRRLIYNSGNNADLIKHLVKLPMLLFFILSAVLIFKWARKLYGNIGAITALILFSFSPTVIAHSRFVTTDVPALFGILLATYYFVRCLKIPNRKNLIIAGLAFGIALLLKFSTFLLVPFFLLLALIYGFASVPRFRNSYYAVRNTILVFLIGFIVIVWPVYLFHTHNYPIERQHNDTTQLLGSYGNRALADPVVWASGKPVIRAAAQYGLGLLMVNQRAVGGNTTYFLGEVSRFGWHKYFPIVYFIKETLAWWGLVIIALIAISIQIKNEKIKIKISNTGNWLRNHLDEFAMLLWLLIYWGLSIRSTLNIGVRHLLPTFPFAIMLVSGQVARLSHGLEAVGYKKRLLTFYVLLFTLLGWHVYENLKVFPYYLTYFNQTAGGPSGGYRYVVDSNVDWGQDLVRFSDWVKKNNIPKVEFDYFGWADPYYYLKDRYIWMSGNKYLNALDFKMRNQSDGWMAVSATFLQGSQGPYDQPNSVNYLWLNSYKPFTVIGNSIFVYRIK